MLYAAVRKNLEETPSRKESSSFIGGGSLNTLQPPGQFFAEGPTVLPALSVKRMCSFCALRETGTDNTRNRDVRKGTSFGRDVRMQSYPRVQHKKPRYTQGYFVRSCCTCEAPPTGGIRHGAGKSASQPFVRLSLPAYRLTHCVRANDHRPIEDQNFEFAKNVVQRQRLLTLIAKGVIAALKTRHNTCALLLPEGAGRRVKDSTNRRVRGHASDHGGEAHRRTSRAGHLRRAARVRRHERADALLTLGVRREALLQGLLLVRLVRIRGERAIASELGPARSRSAIVADRARVAGEPRHHRRRYLQRALHHPDR